MSSDFLQDKLNPEDEDDAERQSVLIDDKTYKVSHTNCNINVKHKCTHKCNTMLHTKVVQRLQCLQMSEKFLSGTKIPNKQTKIT